MYWYDKEPLAGFQLMKCTTKESLKSLLFWLNLATEDLSAKFMLDNYFYNRTYECTCTRQVADTSSTGTTLKYNV